MSFFTLILALLVFIVALIRPHWGAILLISLLPVEAIVPQGLTRGLPVFTSPISLFGGVALIGALMNAVSKRQFDIKRTLTSVVQMSGLLLIAWITFTHPQESWSGPDRNYVFTFVQLWSLLWLAGTMLAEERHQQLLMTWFALACVLSAYVTISGGQIAATREEGIRSAGMMSGLNTAARYYVVGFVFLIYLRTRAEDARVRWLAAGGAVFLLVSVSFLQSRAGIGLALLSIILLLALGPNLQRKKYLTYLLGTIMLVMLLLPSSLWESIGASFFTEESQPRQRFQSIDENIRYQLWRAGLEMWSDNPIAGVGIGQFPAHLNDYLPGLIPGRVGGLASHNMFVRVLSETGIVGFALFTTMILSGLRNLRRARSNNKRAPFQIAEIWFIVLVIIAAGGFWKDDHADKMLWLFLGIASSFGASLKSQIVQTLTPAYLMTSLKAHTGPPPSSRDETNQGNTTSSR